MGLRKMITNSSQLSEKKIHKIIAKQILSTDNEKWNTVPKSYQQLDTLRDQYENENDDQKLQFLGELDKFLQDLEKKYQSI